jgi:DNA-directed RNA polymerase specialized sigma24 family protein
MTWQSDVTPEEWQEWMNRARRLSKARKVVTSLGPDDYAAQAIEKLLKQEKRPANIDGWLALTIGRQYIDRFKKIQARGGASNRDLSDEQWEYEMVCHAIGSPSGLYRKKETVNEVLAILTEREREILIMSAAGYDNHEIAMHLGFRTNKIVATRLGQISQKVRDELSKAIAD